MGVRGEVFSRRLTNVVLILDTAGGLPQVGNRGGGEGEERRRRRRRKAFFADMLGGWVVSFIVSCNCYDCYVYHIS